MPYHPISCFIIKSKAKLISHFLGDVCYILAILVTTLLQLTESFEVAFDTNFFFLEFSTLVYGCPVETTMFPNHSKGIEACVQAISLFTDSMFASLTTC